MLETNDSCGRAEDLVAYLYEEATPTGARDFESHLRLCAACRTELAAFGGVRQAIGDWRLQALGSLTHTAAEPDASTHFNAAVVPERRPASALAALREFFALSTAWMRAATAAVALAFCTLVVIAVAHFVEEPKTVVVQKQVQTGYSQEQVNDLIAEALKRQQESRGQERPAPVKIERVNGTRPEVASQDRRERRVDRPRSSARQPEELASTEYLPFTAGQEDEELPSLTDIVDDANQE